MKDKSQHEKGNVTIPRKRIELTALDLPSPLESPKYRSAAWLAFSPDELLPGGLSFEPPPCCPDSDAIFQAGSI
jgi:hypothetical protein